MLHSLFPLGFLACLACVLCAPLGKGTYSRIVVFGDSLVDNVGGASNARVTARTYSRTGRGLQTPRTLSRSYG